jgi:hypothetical protein
MRLVVSCLSCALLLIACGSDPDRAAGTQSGDRAAARDKGPAVPAVLNQTVDLSACLLTESQGADAALGACPTYVLQSLDYMTTECRAAGGVLNAVPESSIWSLDVDADGKNEILIDLNQNFTCHGAPAVLACGSLGCPYFLYTQRGEAWVELGAVHADDGPGIEVLGGDPGTPATLRGGCLGNRPCSELTHYAWKGNAYDRSWIEYRRHVVDVVPSSLWRLSREAPVLTAPSKDGQQIESYPAGTAVIVLGSSRTAPYKYVSPCNGCRRGFVEAALLEQ